MLPKVIMFAGLLFCTLAVTGEERGRVEYSPAGYFKNYALSACIARGYSSKETVGDAMASAGGYFELGGHPSGAYPEAIRLAEEFLKREYKSYGSDERLTLMKCIDLYHSKELDELTRKYRHKK